MAAKDQVVVVGAGVVGLATAAYLAQSSRYAVVVLEAEEEVAYHQSGRNSGVIHSGLYYRPGSLKAQLTREGRAQLLRFCQQHGVPFALCGKLVVATRERQLTALQELARRGEANGLERLEWVDGKDIPRFEPYARGVAALWVGDTGIVDFRQVAQALARQVEAAGGNILLGFRVEGLHFAGGQWRIWGRRGEVAARGLVVCAGLQGDRLARRAGLTPAVQIVPFRGEYWELAPQRRHLVRHLIYPVPDPRFPFLGVHFTRRVDGRVEAGPNAVLAFAREGYHWSKISWRDLGETLSFPGFWRLVRRYWRTGCGEMFRSLSKAAFCRALQELVPEVRPADLVGRGSGVRAQALDRQGNLLDDFAFSEGPQALFVLNAPSPAATACMAIGRAIGERLKAILT
ncbi:MAG: L-2-hydroxyglutarate oxidase [Thermoanaerobaculum sp.]|nr:L-2-hydroxyglutarate oxidase [Thermoanaerobaculum sp.]MDW7967868.1 L-2-hydroxyglutarate oxidase [Thermoanaerobaculum sp.]